MLSYRCLVLLAFIPVLLRPSNFGEARRTDYRPQTLQHVAPGGDRFLQLAEAEHQKTSASCCINLVLELQSSETGRDDAWVVRGLVSEAGGARSCLS